MPRFYVHFADQWSMQMVPEINVEKRKLPTVGTGRPVRVHVTAPTKDRPAVSIETPRLILRPLETGDQHAMIELYENAREHLSLVLPLSDDGKSPESVFARQLELTQLGEKTGKSFRRIATNRSGTIVGAFNLIVIRRGFENNADVNFWLDPKRTGVGHAQEGLLALMSYSLADLPEGLGLHRIDAWVQPDNAASQKLVKSCGYKKSTDDASHLTTGDAWKVHERWELTINDWQRDFG
jgi:ribosomal-protein-alanine N-acetyltransferase